MLAVAAIALGLLLRAATGHSLLPFQAARLKFEMPIICLFVAQGVARGRILGLLPTAAGLWVWCLCGVLLAAGLAANLRTSGVALILAGMLLNLDIVMGNAGMPVVLGTIGTSSSALSAVRASLGFYVIAHPGSFLVALGDVLPLDALGQRGLASVGDVLLAVGVIVTLVSFPTDESATILWQSRRL